MWPKQTHTHTAQMPSTEGSARRRQKEEEEEDDEKNNKDDKQNSLHHCWKLFGGKNILKMPEQRRA